MPQKIIANKQKLSKELLKSFSEFLEYAPPGRLSRNLRNMLLLWLMHEKDGFPAYTDDLLHDMNELFILLDAAEQEKTISL